MWCHDGQVGGQEQKHFSPLETKLYFHVNSLQKKNLQIVFTVTQQKIKLETVQWKKPRKGNFIKD